MKNSKLAIIGSGATAIYILQHISENCKVLLKQFHSITIFDKNQTMGYGMPYNPNFNDKYNLANISSEEIPKLPQTFSDWLREKDRNYLEKLNIKKFPIKDSEVYSRIALGEYFKAQFKTLVETLKSEGFIVEELSNHKVLDIKPINEKKAIIITSNYEDEFDKILIATGHHWTNHDQPNFGYFGSPWPIFKLLPKLNEFYNFEIGILGASLSAFDVVTSLAHRHGVFTRKNNQLQFELNEKAKGFKLKLHDANGWLPHLQYEQKKPFREIYRHTTRDELFALKKEYEGPFIEVYFREVCKPALIKALEKDKLLDIKMHLLNDDFTFKDFINIMAKNHEYVNSFDGMRKELEKSQRLITMNKPVHWMETLDDLMYSLNFHAEFLLAEDHLFFNNELKPFLMNVIAALPLHSAEILLALYDADCIELIEGKVEIKNVTKNETQIEITDDSGVVKIKKFKIFINSSGNDNIAFNDFPFKSLKTEDKISRPQAPYYFMNSSNNLGQSVSNNVRSDEEKTYLDLGGISVDNTYRIIDNEGQPSQVIHDLAFNHTYGLRPYSYGLQACDATSAIVVQSLGRENLQIDKPITIDTISETYNSAPEL